MKRRAYARGLWTETTGCWQGSIRSGRLAIVALLWLLGGIPSAAAVVIDFEGLLDGELVQTQYAALGLTFGNATALTAGVSLNELENPPHSGQNVVFDDGGPMLISFATPVSSIFGYFTYASRLLFAAFDSMNVPVGLTMSLFSNNQSLSGEPGSLPNELLGISFAGGISSIVITGDLSGGSFTLDDLTFDRVPGRPVSEPTSLALLLALGLVALRRRRGARLPASPRIPG